MTYPSYLLAALLVMLLGACSSDIHSNKSDAADIKQHFDLKGYFDGEVQRLGKKGKATKLVIADGKEESKTLDSVDFQRELALFSMSDINRPAWSEKYFADSSFDNQNQLVHLEIKALDTTLKTQRIGVDFQDGNVSKVQIQNNSASSIATSNQVLTYEPTVGYSIVSNQKVTLTDAQDFRIEVQFYK